MYSHDTDTVSGGGRHAQIEPGPAAPVKVKEAGRRLSQTPAPIDSFQQPEDFISSAQSLRQHSLFSSPLTHNN